MAIEAMVADRARLQDPVGQGPMARDRRGERSKAVADEKRISDVARRDRGKEMKMADRFASSTWVPSLGHYTI